MLDDILIKPFARNLFNNGTNHVEIQVTICIALARFVTAIRFGPIGILCGIDGIKAEITLAIIDGRQMRHHQPKGDNRFRKLWIAHLETDELTHILVNGKFLSFCQLHDGSGRKRF